VDFLDVTLDLNTGLFKPFMKPNNTMLYVNKNSNHPPAVIENLPAAVNRRLSTISADENIFKQAIPPYQKALEASGYDFGLSGVHALPLAAGINVGGHYKWHFFLLSLSFFRLIANYHRRGCRRVSNFCMAPKKNNKNSEKKI
jgi:hypothetical protein